MSAGDRFLLLDQGDATQNGVYSYSSAGSAASRSSDMDANGDFPGAFLFVLQGTFQEQGFVCSNDAVTLGTTDIAFQRFTGTGQITVSGGLQKDADNLSIADSGVSTAKIADSAVTSAKLADAAVSLSLIHI